MTALDRLQNSRAWSFKYGLPLVPEHNNPWIYAAYAILAIRVSGEPALALGPAVFNYWDMCQDGDLSGYFYRWPDRTGGKTSWDEVIGAAALHTGAAFKIADYLNRNDGEFREAGNIYRIPCVRPYVQACAYEKVSLFSQIVWSTYLLAGLWRFDPKDVGPHLRRWLMAGKMRAFPVCAAAIEYWAKRMNQSGLTLKAALLVEPGVPELAEIAGDEWTWPKGPA